MSQPIVFVSKEFMKDKYRVTITGTKEAPGHTVRDLTRDDAVLMIASHLQAGITNVSDAYGLTNEAKELIL